MAHTCYSMNFLMSSQIFLPIVSYLISFIILPSGGVCSALSKSSRTSKQPACLMDYRETSALPGFAMQDENNTLQ
ncbi:hypothetical protein NQZ68_036549 [Dissostichus eleginoides]|nr:hypothetical protein NQZ68_036549 [Dissostichus eleginoides]